MLYNVFGVNTYAITTTIKREEQDNEEDYYCIGNCALCAYCFRPSSWVSSSPPWLGPRLGLGTRRFRRRLCDWFALEPSILHSSLLHHACLHGASLHHACVFNASVQNHNRCGSHPCGDYRAGCIPHLVIGLRQMGDKRKVGS